MTPADVLWVIERNRSLLERIDFFKRKLDEDDPAKRDDYQQRLATLRSNHSEFLNTPIAEQRP